ncbi:hypothetical protein AB833_19830 [Chromatiales bacterium (ex Bugula neritina AB1)]|nr:hypothetical protein AB833_19830 [Chromatiales bacterium (ex Bugula neritina AB1)]
MLTGELPANGPPVRTVPSTPKLPADYYLQNFNTLLDFVFSNYRHLLNEEERHFYHAFNHLVTDSQRLYVRLASRSSEFIRCKSLHYPEIQQTGKTVTNLIDSGFLSIAEASDASEWVSIFTRADLAEVLPAPLKDKQVDASVLQAQDLFGQSPLALLMANHTIVKTRYRATLQCYRLLFFGNLQQDFSAFVLRDLGKRSYEPYPIDHTNLPFTSRRQIEAYLHYYHCCDVYESVKTQGTEALVEIQRSLPLLQADDRTLSRRLAKLSNRIARQLERCNALDEASEIYRTTRRPPARERLARIAHKRGNTAQAFALCQEIEADPGDAEELMFAQQFSTRLAKTGSINYVGETTVKPPMQRLKLEKLSLPVELECALHYAKEGKCFYVENALVGGMFGLATWDILFAPIAGAFFHPFQSAPADFQESDFYSQRESLFEKRFSQINNGLLAELALDNFHYKYGIANPLVSWQRLDRQLLTLALKRISTPDWLHLFDYLCKDIRNNRSGLPDLVFFPDTGGYRFIEVKGPGDRLQKNQLRWMQHFEQGNIEYSVALIEYSLDSASREY